MDAPVSTLGFIGYKVNSIDFKINKNFQKETTPLKVNPQLRISIEKNDDIGVVIIQCSVFDDGLENYPFSLNVEIEGGFNITEVPKDKAERILKQNAVAILYPYLRTTVSGITMIAGIKTLNLPIANINAMDGDTEEK